MAKDARDADGDLASCALGLGVAGSDTGTEIELQQGSRVLIRIRKAENESRERSMKRHGASAPGNRASRAARRDVDGKMIALPDPAERRYGAGNAVGDKRTGTLL